MTLTMTRRAISHGIAAVAVSFFASAGSAESAPLYGLFGQSNARIVQESSTYQPNDYTTLIKGGSPLHSNETQMDWNASSRGELFDEMLATIERDRPTLGSIWMQGERDARELIHSESYEENLRELLNGYNESSNDAPLVIVLLSAKSARAIDSNPDQVEIVRRAQASVAEDFSNVILLDPDELDPDFYDKIHYAPEFAASLLEQAQTLLHENAASRNTGPNPFQALHCGVDDQACLLTGNSAHGATTTNPNSGTASVSTPGSLALIFAGLIGVGGFRRRNV